MIWQKVKEERYLVMSNPENEKLLNENLLAQNDFTPKEAVDYIYLKTRKKRSRYTLLVHCKNYRDTGGRKGIKSHKRGYQLLIMKEDLDRYIATTMGNVGSKKKNFSRGVCPICKQDAPVNDKGRIMRHGYTGHSVPVDNPKEACKGTGKKAR